MAGATEMRFAPVVEWDAEVEAYLRGALGNRRFERTAAALCRPPLSTCLRINTLRMQPEDAVAAVQRQLGPDAPTNAVRVHPLVPCAVILQGSGPHGVDFAAAGGKEVIVSRKAGEAVLRGAPVYAPGVLAGSAGISRGDLVAVAVGMERPGSDTPVITRGTTLLTDAVAPAAQGPQAEVAAAASTSLHGASTRPSGASASSSSGAQPGTAHQAVAAAGAAAGEREGAEGSTPEGQEHREAAGTSGSAKEEGGGDVQQQQQQQQQQPGRRRQRQRARQRERQRQQRDGVDPAAAGGGGAAASTCGEQEDDEGHQAGAGSGDRAAAQPQPQAQAQSQPHASPGPGWTASSQGPLPPRWGLYVGVARAAMSRQEVFRAAAGLALEMVEPVYRVPPAAACLPPGTAMLQNLPSVVAALALAPPRGARVLDMCAAPGGKATLLAQLMGNEGEVVAFDRTHAKVDEIKALAAELGATCVTARRMDAGRAVERPARASAQPEEQEGGPHAAASGAGGIAEAAADAEADAGAAAAGPLLPAHGSRANGGGGGGGGAGGLSEKARRREERRAAAMLRRGITPPPPRDAAADAGPPAYAPESFDALLLDAPCSALGLRPRLQQHSSALYLRQCAAAQRRLVDAAVRLLRVGGAMVYSTCTINPGENEAVVRYLLDTYRSSFRLEQAGPPLVGGPGLVGRHPTHAEAGVPLDAPSELGAGVDSAAGGGGGIAGGGEAWLTDDEARLVQRFDPADPHGEDTIGFFVAKFVKTAPVAE